MTSLRAGGILGRGGVARAAPKGIGEITSQRGLGVHARPLRSAREGASYDHRIEHDRAAEAGSGIAGQASAAEGGVRRPYPARDRPRAAQVQDRPFRPGARHPRQVPAGDHRVRRRSGGIYRILPARAAARLQADLRAGRRRSALGRAQRPGQLLRGVQASQRQGARPVRGRARGAGLAVQLFPEDGARDRGIARPEAAAAKRAGGRRRRRPERRRGQRRGAPCRRGGPHRGRRRLHRRRRRRAAARRITAGADLDSGAQPARPVRGRNAGGSRR